MVAMRDTCPTIGRGALRVCWRAAREPNQKRPTASRKTKRRFVRENFHLVVNKNQDGYGYFGKISSATFWTPGYVSPVHTTSKPASRRRLNTCHGPG